MFAFIALLAQHGDRLIGALVPVVTRCMAVAAVTDIRTFNEGRHSAGRSVNSCGCVSLTIGYKKLSPC